MKVLGHELGKRLFFDINLEIEYLQRHIKDLDEMKAGMLQTAAGMICNHDGSRIERAIANIDSVIEMHQKTIARDRQHLQKFAEVIRMLPDNQKQFAKLHYIDGKTIEEIAEIMYYSVRNVHHIQQKTETEIEKNFHKG